MQMNDRILVAETSKYTSKTVAQILSFSVLSLLGVVGINSANSNNPDDCGGHITHPKPWLKFSVSQFSVSSESWELIPPIPTIQRSTVGIGLGSMSLYHIGD
jgi:hypothetical protein